LQINWGNQGAFRNSKIKNPNPREENGAMEKLPLVGVA
jgi:hypothetical protein